VVSRKNGKQTEAAETADRIFPNIVAAIGNTPSCD